MRKKHTSRADVQLAVLPRLETSLLDLVNHFRVEAAKPIDEVFERRQKLANRVPGFHRTCISRAASGSTDNPLYRAALMLLAARDGGLPRSSGERIANWVQHVVDVLWPAERVCVVEAMRAEQAQDGIEDFAQFEFLAGGETRQQLLDWIEAAERYRAKLDVTIAAAHARVVEHQANAA